MSKEGALTGVLTAYREARGEARDEAWAQRAVAAMLLEHVDGAAARSELEDALTLVRESGEGPQALYGDAAEWVASRLREAPEEGRVLVDGTPDTSWRDALVIGCVVAAVLTVMQLVVLLLTDGWTTDYRWGWVLFPLVSGLMCTLALAAWERVLLRRPRWVAVAAAGAVVVIGVLALTGLVMGVDAVFATASTFWWGALAVAYAVLAGLLERVLPEPSGGSSPDLSDDEWERRLAGTLRMRMDLDEARVRDIVHEARAHATESGRSLAAEFGDPALYAARFERDRVAGLRRFAWIQSALVPLALFITFAGVVEEPSSGWSGISWPGVLLLVVGTWATVSAWRRVRRAGDQRG